MGQETFVRFSVSRFEYNLGLAELTHGILDVCFFNSIQKSLTADTHGKAILKSVQFYALCV